MSKQLNIDDEVIHGNVKYTVYSIIDHDTVLITTDGKTVFIPVLVKNLSKANEKVEFTVEQRDEMIQNWLKVKSDMTHFKQQENELRNEIVENFFNAKKEKGTQSLKLTDDGSYQLKCVKKINTSVENDKEKINEIVAELPPEFSEIFKWKPSLNEKLFKELNDEQKQLVEKVLTTKPGQPELKFVEPKKEEV